MTRYTILLVLSAAKLLTVNISLSVERYWKERCPTTHFEYGRNFREVLCGGPCSVKAKRINPGDFLYGVAPGGIDGASSRMFIDWDWIDTWLG